eukprot:TRINITY_DN14715_c0_g1_i4.p1 TRINITY_DN14715_c0_g1~~TRINITY_DN14715_c0_g1_i4.p1  ORF type:complete len:604 (+),score=78.12 TRINITY_DN14715_c0_g1_i4:64-1875(+)
MSVHYADQPTTEEHMQRARAGNRRTSIFTRFTDAQTAKFHQIFQQFDADGNGHIDEHELHSIMLRLGRDLEEGEAKKLIEMVDTDGSGVIYFDEFMRMLEMQIDEQKKRIFNKDVFRSVFNKSGSGLMTRDELRTGMLSLGFRMEDDEIDEMIAVADRTGKGMLSFEDFNRMLRGATQGRRASMVVMECWKKVFDEAPKVAEKYSMVNRCAKPMRDFRHSSHFQEGKTKTLTTDNSRALQPAIDGSGQNDTIEVQAGVLTEPIVVNIEGMTLRGATEGKTVIEVNSKYPALTLRCKRCFIENLEIINHGAGPAVQVDQGFPDLTNLVITGQNGGLLVKNRSHPLVKNCVFKDSGRAWGMLMRESKAIIEGCTFTGNSDGGLVVERSSSPWICKSTFTKGKGCGCVFDETASGVICESLIAENGCNGVLVTNGANPILWKNEIRDGEAAGIAVREGGRGHYEENLFCNNASSELEVLSKANPLFRKNTLSGGEGSAILIEDGGQGSYEVNTINNYKLAGVSIGKDASPQVVDNMIHSHADILGTCGVAVKEEASGRVIDNTLIGWEPHRTGGSRQVCRDTIAYNHSPCPREWQYTSVGSTLVRC